VDAALREPDGSDLELEAGSDPPSDATVAPDGAPLPADAPAASVARDAAVLPAALDAPAPGRPDVALPPPDLAMPRPDVALPPNLCGPGACAPRDDCHDIGVCAPSTGMCSAVLKPDQTPCACVTHDCACVRGICLPPDQPPSVKGPSAEQTTA